jgi:hypothetical protein
MTIAAGVRLKEKEAELDSVLSDVRLRLKREPGVLYLSSDDEVQVQASNSRRAADLRLFEECQEKWLAYRKAFCDFAYGSPEGTIWPNALGP